MQGEIIGSLNRTAKLFIDSGRAASIDEALATLGAFRMHLEIRAEAAGSVTHQAALLTALNCGVRTMLGGVTVGGALDEPLLVPVASGPTLAEAVAELGGRIAACPADTPVVAIGGGYAPVHGQFAVRTTFDGWRGGVVPATAAGLDEAREFPLSGVLGAALAVAEVFAHLNGEAIAGHRSVGLSLWDLGEEADWRSADSDGPQMSALPSDFWVIGLGHLGQAFLWTIGVLPFADPSAVRLFLQDVDRAGESTPSTSVLTQASDQRRLKTRICADWAERRGFETRLIERRFGPDLKVEPNEPALALCGVDNPDARRTLDTAGFSMVFEAGLGNGVEDFRLIRMHSFPGPQSSAQLWPSADLGRDATPIEVLARPAYLGLQSAGALDTCGLTRLAHVAVGAPFVGMTAAAVVIAQIVRVICGAPRVSVVNLDLRSMAHRTAITNSEDDLIAFATVARN